MRCCHHCHTAGVHDLHGSLLLKPIQFNPALVQSDKHRRSCNLITYEVPALLCLCRSLNEGAKSLSATLLSWQSHLLPHTAQLSHALPVTALADGRSYVLKARYEVLARQALIDLSGSCADKSSPFKNIPNLLCIFTGEE